MTTTEQPQAVHKTVVGVCESVAERNGWHEFNIKIEGNSYPLRLSTKKPELVTLGQAIYHAKAVAEWGYLESRGNPNPKRPGQFFMNRWLDSAAVVSEHVEETDPAVTPAMPHPAELPDAPPPPVDWDAKDLRRHRQAAVAIAVSYSAQFEKPTSLTGVLDVAETIVQFVYRKVEYAAAEDLVPDDPDFIDADQIPFE